VAQKFIAHHAQSLLFLFIPGLGKFVYVKNNTVLPVHIDVIRRFILSLVTFKILIYLGIRLAYADVLFALVHKIRFTFCVLRIGVKLRRGVLVLYSFSLQFIIRFSLSEFLQNQGVVFFCVGHGDVCVVGHSACRRLSGRKGPFINSAFFKIRRVGILPHSVGFLIFKFQFFIGVVDSVYPAHPVYVSAVFCFITQKRRVQFTL